MEQFAPWHLCTPEVRNSTVNPGFGLPNSSLHDWLSMLELSLKKALPVAACMKCATRLCARIYERSIAILDNP